VYGNRLVWISDSKVYLDSGGQRVALDLYAKQTVSPGNTAPVDASVSPGNLSQTLSRAEMRQKVFNNMDNALRGIQAGPYRVNGKIVGYRLINVRPYSVLFKLGARSGDIVRRVNGQQLDSTEKLMSMWEAIKNDPKITVDLERGGKAVQYDFNITD
jgi:general secretion pathway protein C